MKDIHEIEDVLTKEFSAPYEWFVENKFRIDFEKDKTKCILSFKTKSQSWTELKQNSNFSISKTNILTLRRIRLLYNA